MGFYGNHYKFRFVRLLTIYLEGFYGCTISASLLIAVSDSRYNGRTSEGWSYVFVVQLKQRWVKHENSSPSLNLHIWEIRREVRLYVSTRVARDQTKSHMNLQEMIQIYNHFIWSQMSNGLWKFHPIASSLSYLPLRVRPLKWHRFAPTFSSSPLNLSR